MIINSSVRLFFLELNYYLYYNNLVQETGETVFRRTSIIHGGFIAVRLYITECGAVGDGETLCTEAINAAVSKVAEAGGGYVLVPPGKFVSGTIFLKSNVYLYLEAGSTILGSMDRKDFIGQCKHMPDTCLVSGEELENTGIMGEGTLDLRRQDIGYTSEHGRPVMILIADSKNVTVSGVSLINTGFFTIYCVGNTNVTFDRLIINSENCENGDGIDFSGSKNVTISNCKIRCWDDAIGLKTHRKDVPCENFTITNCVLSSNWAGVRLGPETCGDMKNISISNCVFNNCSDGIKVQLCEGYRMEDLTFSNLNMVNVLRPFFFTSSSVPMGFDSLRPRPEPGTFKRVLISNVIAHIRTRPNWFETNIVIHGIPDSYIEDVIFNNLYVVNLGGGKKDDGKSAENEDLISYGHWPDLVFDWEPYPCACMYIRNVKGIKFYNCFFETDAPDERPAIVAQAVDDIKLCQCESKNTGSLLRHCGTTGVKIINCEGIVDEYDDEYKARWEKFRKYTVDFENKVIENGLVVRKLLACQAASSFKCSEILDESDKTKTAFDLDYSGGQVYLVVSNVNTKLQIFVNGKEAFCWDGPETDHYRFRVAVAADITNALVTGKNSIELKVSGFDDDLSNKSVSQYVL